MTALMEKETPLARSGRPLLITLVMLGFLPTSCKPNRVGLAETGYRSSRANPPAARCTGSRGDLPASRCAGSRGNLPAAGGATSRGNPHHSASPRYTVAMVLANRTGLTGKRITVSGIAHEVDRKGCTLMFCSKNHPCCNHCSSPLALRGHRSAQMILLARGHGAKEGVGCYGSNCRLECRPLKPGRKYLVVGTLSSAPLVRLKRDILLTGLKQPVLRLIRFKELGMP